MSETPWMTDTPQMDETPRMDETPQMDETPRTARAVIEQKLREGAAVMDAGGETIGTTGGYDLEQGYMLVGGGMLFPQDTRVPLDAIGDTGASGLYLRGDKDDLLRQYGGAGDTSSMDASSTPAGTPATRVTPPVVGDAQPPVEEESGTAADTTALGSGYDGGSELRLPVYEEALVVQTRPQEIGRVRVHKTVETVEQQFTAPVVREEVTVERIPADQYDASAPADPDTTVIPVVEERLVVETRAVVVEYVCIRKRRVTEEQDVRAPVRREVVTVEDLAASGDTTDGQPQVDETPATHN